MDLPLTQEQKALAEHWCHLPYRVVKELSVNFPIIRRRKDDFIDIGQIALVLAARKYDPQRGQASFFTYARRAIIRKMVMEARNFSIVHIPQWLTRGDRPLTEKENRQVRQVSMIGSVSAKERFDPTSTKQANADTEWLLERMYTALQEIAPKLAQVLRWRFFDGLGLKEVGAKLGVCKERVRQLQNQALAAMRELLEE